MKFDLQKFSKETGISNVKIAGYLGVTPIFISLVKNGKKNLSLDNILRLKQLNPNIWEDCVEREEGDELKELEANKKAYDVISSGHPVDMDFNIKQFCRHAKMDLSQVAEYLDLDTSYLSLVQDEGLKLPVKSVMRLKQLNEEVWKKCIDQLNFGLLRTLGHIPDEHHGNKRFYIKSNPLSESENFEKGNEEKGSTELELLKLENAKLKSENEKLNSENDKLRMELEIKNKIIKDLIKEIKGTGQKTDTGEDNQ